MTNAIQTVTPSLGGNPLPPSTGQCCDVASLQAVLVANAAWCAAQTPPWVYTLAPDNSSLTFTDPASGITITQAYVVDPHGFYDPAPVHPFGGSTAPPPPFGTAPWPAPISGPPIGAAGMLTGFIWGQSHIGNFINGRYASKNAGMTFAYGHDGNWYPMSDPIVFAYDGTDGNVLSRLADQCIGRNRPTTGNPINRVAFGGCPLGGTSINDWAPGGGFNPLLISTLTAFKAAIGADPDFLYYDQGAADVLDMSTAAWVSQWFAMLNSVRAVTTAKIGTAISTMCNSRDVSNPAPNPQMSRTPDVLISYEVGRQNIRAAQIQVGAVNSNTFHGANNDTTVDYLLRASEGDGCHWGSKSAMAVAKAQAAAICP